MPTSRSFAGFVLTLLAAATAADAAEFACPVEPQALPNEAWGDVRSASSDELYRRVRDGLWHWSRDPELEFAIRDALGELLAREPGDARGYIEVARLVISRGTIDNFTLSEPAYDIAGQALERAIALNPESAAAWALEGLFRQHRRGRIIEYGNGKSPQEALEIAERLDPLGPDVVFARADWHTLFRRYEQATEKINALLEVENLSDVVLASAHQRLARQYAGMGQQGAAVRAAEKAIDVQRANPANWLTLSSMVLETRGDADRAIESARTALCLDATARARRLLAYALYVAWAHDNSGKARPNTDDERVIEAFDLYPNVAGVMGYMADHAQLASLVDTFIAAGLSPDTEDSHDGLTMLHDAVKDGRLADASRLIELGADVNRVDERNGSLLLQAALNRNIRMVRLLLENGADVNLHTLPWGTALFGSIMAGDEQIAEVLLDAGANPDLTNDQGETALAFAATAYDDPEKRSRFVTLLLDAGANPDVDFRPGKSLIDLTLELRYAEVAELLSRASRERANR